jgi:hypothetical protein
LEYDVPVLLLSGEAAALVERPQNPRLNVMLSMHEDSLLKSVTDRLRTISKFVTLEVKPTGTVALTAQNELVAIRAFFTDLECHELSTHSESHARSLS